MIVCPRCSQENEDAAANCVNCGIDLRWALENPRQRGRQGLQGGKGPPPVAQRADREIRVETRPTRGLLGVVLLLAGLAWLSMSCRWALFLGTLDTVHHVPRLEVIARVAVVAAAGIVVALILLLREPRPDIGRALKLLALIVLVGGLGYGLLRLTAVIFPAHAMIIQYELGERDFKGMRLNGADLSEADLHGIRLHEAHLSEADLSGADLSSADLWDADLSGADLSGTNLSSASLISADLRAARLYDANLVTARLRKANLTGADLREADLRRANLTGALVTDEQLAQAESLEGTILPDGTMHE